MGSLPRAVDYVSIWFDELENRLGSKVDRNEGSQFDAMGGALAALFVRSNKVQVDSFDAHTRETAVGQALDDYCSKHGPIRRFGASRTRGHCEWQRVDALFGSTEIPAGHRMRAPFEGKSYVFETISAKPVGAAALSVVADIRAIADGADYNVGQQGNGLSNVDALDDAKLLPFVMMVSGGSPAETDDELRYRQRLYEENTERSSLAGITLGALAVPGVKKVVIATRDDEHMGGQGRIYVGDRDWQSSETMLREVAASLESYRGLRALSIGGMQNNDVPIEGYLEMAQPTTSYDTESVRETAVRRVIEYFDNRRTPHEYSVTSIAGRIERAHEEALRAVLTLPASSTTNPLSPTSLALAGFPFVLPRYRTNASIINLEIKGPS
jgi:uncharacterized phage protein gp47/JayE